MPTAYAYASLGINYFSIRTNKHQSKGIILCYNIAQLDFQLISVSERFKVPRTIFCPYLFLFPISVETLEASKHKGMIILLLGNPGRPVPRARQAAVDAAATVVAAPIKAVLEVISQNHQFQVFTRAKVVHNVFVQLGVGLKLWNLCYEIADGIQDIGNLRVLVDEDERVGDVSVAEVND